jgi:hypothetical protein
MFLANTIRADRIRDDMESVAAEKFEAMVKLGLANSRMKDFYDLWVLAQRFEFQVRKRARVLKRYWAVPGRHIERSVALAESKESTSFSARPIRFTYRNRLHRVGQRTTLFGGGCHEHDNSGDQTGHDPYQRLDR